jgi:4-amino-4-deoxy-L-arabinose transferase-like glycosyltransferase
LIRWGYKEGFALSLGLVLILSIFIAIKVPYFDKTPTGHHNTKYMTHVDPARNMYENNNPFRMQKKYRVDPVNNPKGLINNFGRPPLNEWGLLTTFYLFPENSIIFNTHIFTCFLGVLILIFAYSFFKKWLPKTQTIIIIYLMAINPIINFASYITVQDSWLIIITFLTLISLTNYLKQKEDKKLLTTSLLFGIGTIIKPSIFLWLTPIVSIIIFLKNKKIATTIREITTIILIVLFSIILYAKVWPYSLPTNSLLFALKLIIMAIVYYSIYLMIKKLNNKKVELFIQKAIRNKGLLISLFFSLILIVFSFFQITNINRFSGDFLTDSELIFNWKVYYHMLNVQFKSYLSESIFYIGIIGIFISIFLYRIYKRRLFILLSFGVGSLFYWVAASKSIFFHSYYTNIIVITFLISASLLFYILILTAKNNKIKILYLLLIFIIISPGAYKATANQLMKEKDLVYVEKLNEYLTKKVQEDELLIDERWSFNYVTIMTGIPKTNIPKLNQDKIKESIKEQGFAQAMQKYKIKYIITENKEPLYEKYLTLFLNEKEIASINKDTIKTERTDLIEEKINSTKKVTTADIKDLIKKYNIEEKFKLEKKIGPYKIFSFQN